MIVLFVFTRYWRFPVIHTISQSATKLWCAHEKQKRIVRTAAGAFPSAKHPPPCHVLCRKLLAPEGKPKSLVLGITRPSGGRGVLTQARNMEDLIDVIVVVLSGAELREATAERGFACVRVEFAFARHGEPELRRRVIAVYEHAGLFRDALSSLSIMLAFCNKRDKRRKKNCRAFQAHHQ